MTQLSLWKPNPFENEWVKLIPLHPTDYEKVYAIASDPLLWAQHPSSERYKPEIFAPFFEDILALEAPFVIVDKKTNQIIGSTSYYDYRSENSSIAIGYTFLSRAYWASVYNYKTKELLLNYAFQHVNNVYFHIGASNFRSQKAVQKLGAYLVREYISEKFNRKTESQEFLLTQDLWKQTQENHYTLQLAQSEDIPPILNILAHVLSLQGKQGYYVWDTLDTHKMIEDINAQKVYTLVKEGEIAFVFTLIDQDPFIWLEKDQQNALYLHRMLTHPKYKGKRLFQKVLDWVKKQAQTKQLPYVRMDTWANNSQLIEYYASFGFEHLGNQEMGNVLELPIQNRNLTVALLELKV